MSCSLALGVTNFYIKYVLYTIFLSLSVSLCLFSASFLFLFHCFAAKIHNISFVPLLSLSLLSNFPKAGKLQA